MTRKRRNDFSERLNNCCGHRPSLQRGKGIENWLHFSHTETERKESVTIK